MTVTRSCCACPTGRCGCRRSTSKAVRALLDGERLRVADLPDLDDDDAMSLARRLVREAVVVVDVAAEGS